MTEIERKVLEVLRKHDGSVSRETLIEQTGVQDQHLYAAVASLESQGLVKTLEELGSTPWYAVELSDS